MAHLKCNRPTVEMANAVRWQRCFVKHAPGTSSLSVRIWQGLASNISRLNLWRDVCLHLDPCRTGILSAHNHRLEEKWRSSYRNRRSHLRATQEDVNMNRLQFYETEALYVARPRYVTPLIDLSGYRGPEDWVLSEDLATRCRRTTPCIPNTMDSLQLIHRLPYLTS